MRPSKPTFDDCLRSLGKGLASLLRASVDLMGGRSAMAAIEVTGTALHERMGRSEADLLVLAVGGLIFLVEMLLEMG